MGHQSGKPLHSRRGSLQYWPRKRARRIFPRVKSWPKISEPRLLGFAGYKAGMTHVTITDTKKTSPTYNQQISVPVTIIETPPIRALSLRFYKKTPYGNKVVRDILVEKIDKEVKRRTSLPKKIKAQEPEDYDYVHLLCYSQPKLITLKKKPEIFEIALGGTKEEQLKLAKSLIGKDIKALILPTPTCNNPGPSKIPLCGEGLGFCYPRGDLLCWKFMDLLKSQISNYKYQTISNRST